MLQEEEVFVEYAENPGLRRWKRAWITLDPLTGQGRLRFRKAWFKKPQILEWEIGQLTGFKVQMVANPHWYLHAPTFSVFFALVVYGLFQRFHLDDTWLDAFDSIIVMIASGVSTWGVSYLLKVPVLYFRLGDVPGVHPAQDAVKARLVREMVDLTEAEIEHKIQTGEGLPENLRDLPERLRKMTDLLDPGAYRLSGPPWKSVQKTRHLLQSFEETQFSRRAAAGISTPADIPWQRTQTLITLSNILSWALFLGAMGYAVWATFGG